MGNIENGWTAQIIELEEEVRRLNAERIAIQSSSRALTCVFCGHVYPPGTPPSNHEALIAHVEECPKHPMRRWKLRARAAERHLRFCREALAFAGSPDSQLSAMKGVLTGCNEFQLAATVDSELEYRKFESEIQG